MIFSLSSAWRAIQYLFKAGNPFSSCHWLHKMQDRLYKNKLCLRALEKPVSVGKSFRKVQENGLTEKGINSVIESF